MSPPTRSFWSVHDGPVGGQCQSCGRDSHFSYIFERTEVIKKQGGGINFEVDKIILCHRCRQEMRPTGTRKSIGELVGKPTGKTGNNIPAKPPIY